MSIPLSPPHLPHTHLLPPSNCLPLLHSFPSFSRLLFLLLFSQFLIGLFFRTRSVTLEGSEGVSVCCMSDLNSYAVESIVERIPHGTIDATYPYALLDGNGLEWAVGGGNGIEGKIQREEQEEEEEKKGKSRRRNRRRRKIGG